jgi:alpha-L-fucosidase
MEGEPYVSFGYTYDQDYLSPSETLHIFLEIVARGGNLALNIGAQPDGRLPVRAMRSLRQFGRWMKVFGRGIYGTRPCAPYFEGNCRYLKKQDHLYVFRLYEDAEAAPSQVTFTVDAPVRSVTYMRTEQPVAFTQKGSAMTVEMPVGLVGARGLMADGFELSVSQYVQG